jgi:CHAT domain-containing protein
MTKDDDPSLAIRLNNLGNSLRQRYERTQAVSDLNLAIEVYRRTVGLTSSTDPLLPSRLYNLGNSLYLYYELTGDPDDLEQAVLSYRNACTFGLDYSLEQVLGAAKVWGGRAEQRKAWEEAKEAYSYGLKAINQLYNNQLLSESKGAWLKDARDLAGNAAYVLARLGELREAVVTLERNRTRVLSEALTYQDVSIEAASGSDRVALTRATQRIRDLENEARAIGQGGARDFLAVSTGLRDAREELSAIIERIRGYLPDFATEGLDFPAITALVDAINQPLVYLITTLNGSLALIVIPANITAPNADVIHPVWLDDFSAYTLNDILYDQGSLPRYLRGIAIGETHVLLRVVDDIWSILEDRLMKAISIRLQELGQQRAVLIPAGALSLLPMHAVALDDIAFTFIPSARALRSVYYDKDHIDLPPALLGVGNPFSYQRQSLSFAHYEVEKIAELFGGCGGKSDTLYESFATRADVIASIPARTHLHFACHGSFNVDNPMESALFLAGADALTLRDLLDGKLDVFALRLVVLSACQTGIIDFRNAPDETVGFPAGFIRASVPGVVSTLWPVDDLSTAILLTKFYQHHIQDGLEPAIALREAQLWLRDATASRMNLAGIYEQLYNASQRRDPRAFKAMRYYQANPGVKPFSHPYYWAAFAFTGV